MQGEEVCQRAGWAEEKLQCCKGALVTFIHSKFSLQCGFGRSISLKCSMGCYRRATFLFHAFRFPWWLIVLAGRPRPREFMRVMRSTH